MKFGKTVAIAARYSNGAMLPYGTCHKRVIHQTVQSKPNLTDKWKSGEHPDPVGLAPCRIAKLPAEGRSLMLVLFDQTLAMVGFRPGCRRAMLGHVPLGPEGHSEIQLREGPAAPNPKPGTGGRYGL